MSAEIFFFFSSLKNSYKSYNFYIQFKEQKGHFFTSFFLLIRTEQNVSKILVIYAEFFLQFQSVSTDVYSMLRAKAGFLESFYSCVAFGYRNKSLFIS